MPNTVREPWSDAWDVRDSLAFLRDDATARGLEISPIVYQQSIVRLDCEILNMINQDTRKRVEKL
jgi:hypothetical protein